MRNVGRGRHGEEQKGDELAQAETETMEDQKGEEEAPPNQAGNQQIASRQGQDSGNMEAGGEAGTSQGVGRPTVRGTSGR